MKIIPTLDNVVIRRDKVEDKTPGGLYIPEGAKDAPKRGTIIAVGPGKFQGGHMVPTLLKKNQKVLFGAYAGTEVQLVDKGEKLIMMAENEVLGVIVE